MCSDTKNDKEDDQKMKSFAIYIKISLIALAAALVAQSAFAYVPVRISIKFIVDVNGNRPATGNLNTDAEINAEVDWASTILAGVLSEHRVDLLELYDLTGVSQWYNVSSTFNNCQNVTALRNAAVASPATYGWRNDAINIYINGHATSSACSNFPPNNDIILMSQSCANNPSCVLHEMGHSLNLLHTHEPCCTNQDYCADTITDSSGWTRDQIANNNFGCLYANCTAAQQDQVDLVFNNVMSYHVGEPQLRLSACQKDRTSTQGDSDRNWLLTHIPIYVDSTYSGSQNGRFPTPYSTLQGAVNAGGLSGKVIVLEQGSYLLNTVISTNADMVTRSGPSIVDHGAYLYHVPTDLENSKTPEVSNAVKAARSEDKAARKAMKDGKAAAKKAKTSQERASIMANAKTRKKEHEDNALSSLLKAEKFASGEEKIALQYELGQRYRDAGNCADAIKFFDLVAAGTSQEHLRERVLSEIKQCQTKLDSSRQMGGSKQGE